MTTSPRKLYLNNLLILHGPQHKLQPSDFYSTSWLYSLYLCICVRDYSTPYTPMSASIPVNRMDSVSFRRTTDYLKTSKDLKWRSHLYFHPFTSIRSVPFVMLIFISPYLVVLLTIFDMVRTYRFFPHHSLIRPPLVVLSTAVPLI